MITHSIHSVLHSLGGVQVRERGTLCVCVCVCVHACMQIVCVCVCAHVCFQDRNNIFLKNVGDKR